jgi:hypothetical protein
MTNNPITRIITPTSNKVNPLTEVSDRRVADGVPIRNRKVISPEVVADGGNFSREWLPTVGVEIGFINGRRV